MPPVPAFAPEPPDPLKGGTTGVDASPQLTTSASSADTTADPPMVGVLRVDVVFETLVIVVGIPLGIRALRRPGGTRRPAAPDSR
jgi:hypothetical protein